MTLLASFFLPSVSFTNMYMYIHVYTCIYMYIHMYIIIIIYAYVHVHVHVLCPSTTTCTYMYMYMHTCTNPPFSCGEQLALVVLVFLGVVLEIAEHGGKLRHEVFQQINSSWRVGPAIARLATVALELVM